MKISLSIVVLPILALFIVSFAGPVFAPVPQVQNVVPYNVGVSTFLNITVWHNIENPSHYVDMINVTMGTNTTTMVIGVQNLEPDGTFKVTYDLGPISGTPTVTVTAHCIVNGWSAPWSGQVPEYSTTALMLAILMVVTSGVLLVRRARLRTCK
jgi:hypothetical protein